MQDKTTYELVMRINLIMIERNKLDIEHNEIVKELQRRYPQLKDDENIQLIKTQDFHQKLS
jgi:uncharacterized protein YacL (UPF0231 family)